MEMEASRRSVLDRSREPGAKKPRLTAESERDRGPSAGITSDRSRFYAQVRPAVGGGGGANPRFRASEREEREEVGRGGSSYQQQQELVAQYRTALAELTFNSKPIITNLTIIAGESLHVAKSIVATVCDNVLEVPSEQKLPSLYLLDSIVKNIGGDYVKYFAARLPQVFCKAYNQVDPSMHHSLRHLFGTWKGYFPTSCLQSIENELGFQHVINNGSSGSTGTRPDAPSQRPSHSIHVNPKYLEARQRFQQSTKGKEISSEDNDEIPAPVDDSERSMKNPSSGSTRQWPELSNKDVQHPQRDQPSDFSERKGFKDVRDTGFSSQLSRQQDAGAGRIAGRSKDSDEPGRAVEQISEQDEPNKPYYEAGGAAQSAVFRRNGFDANLAYGSDRALGSARSNSEAPSIRSGRTNWPVAKNWKTSEEEEFIWDDMGSRPADYGGGSSRRNALSTDEQDKPPSLQNLKWMSMETDQAESRLNNVFHPRSKIVGKEDRIHFPRDHEEHYSQQQHSQEIEPRVNKVAWPPPLRDPALPSLGLDHTISRVSGQTERRPAPPGSVLSTNDSSIMPRSGFQSTLPSSLGSSMDVFGPGGALGQQRQLPLRSPSPTFPSIPSPTLQQPKLRGLIDQDYVPFRPSSIGHVLSENPGQKPRTPSNSPYPELKQYLSSRSDPSIQAVSNEAPAPVTQAFRANEFKGFFPVDAVSGQPNTSNLLASILKSDFLPNNPASGLNIHPPLPSGPPPAQSPSLPVETASFASLLPGGLMPPLPPGPPPSTSLVDTSPPQAARPASLDLNNPLSSLLSSLVAKGLITSAPAVAPNQMSKESSSQSSDLDASTSTPPFSSKAPPVCEASSPRRVSPDGDLIGVRFKTEIIREFHPSVISSILDDLKHRCISCGLRFRRQHQLRAHLEWHDSNESETGGFDGTCRRWYSSIDGWVSGDVEPPCGPATGGFLESEPYEEPPEPMVAADERQSICVLCGEPFEDLYSVARDEWMFKGTVYLSLGMGNNTVEGPIVHYKCSISVSEGGDGDGVDQS